MIDYETFCKIRHLFDQKHLKVSQIAAELKLDLRTVQHWVRQRSYRQRRGSRRPSKLDPFKAQIAALLERHPYTAQQLLQQLRSQGYQGGYSILKNFVRQIRPVAKPAYLTLQFAPAECAQVDWGNFGSIPLGATRRRLSFFVMVLCYSRMMYLEFTLAEGMEHFLSCHQRALEFFGGTPRKVMIDNLKVGVLHHRPGEKAQFNPRYLDLAAHYGFEPVACNVRKANEKGRVENAVGYVKKNFLNGLDVPSLAALQPAGRQWLETVANVRIHRETQRKPLDMFAQEKQRLQPLPAMAYDCAVVRPCWANSRCRVTLDTNRYSVPYLCASQKLTLKLYPEHLALYHNEKLIATHVRSYERGRQIDNPDHLKELLNQRQKARRQTALQSFMNLSPQAELYCRRLEQKRLNALHHIQKIVALSQIYGAQKVAAALDEAIAFEAYGCDYIANILEQRERITPTAGPLHLTCGQDLLDLELPPPDLSPYNSSEPSP